MTVMKNKESLRNYHGKGGDEGDLMTKCNVVSCLGKEGALGKNYGNLN